MVDREKAGVVAALDQEAVKVAVQMVGQEDSVPVPQGVAGGCVACGHSVLAHFHLFEGRVRFVGCLQGKPDTVFILVPVVTERRGRRAEDRVGALNNDHPQPPPPGISSLSRRRFRRAIYRSKLHHKASIKKLHLSETREKVMTAVHSTGKVGIRTRDIIAKTKLKNETIQQTLDWLRKQDMVEPEEDIKNAPPLNVADDNSINLTPSTTPLAEAK